MTDTSKFIKLKPHIENILRERYYLNEESSWGQLAKRVSFAYPPMYQYIVDRTFLPSTPTLMNLNTKGERRGTLSSCFILDIEDSVEGIMEAMKEAAVVTKMSGGVGYNFSKLRGSSENVKSISANSGGVLPFIGIFDAILDGVRQGGRRRGAGMSLLSVYHPDILKFLDAKYADTKVYTRSNFSIVIDSEFYKTLTTNPDKLFRTKNVVDGKEQILKDEKTSANYTYKTLWNKIVHHAWKSAEPGIFNGDIAAERCSCKHVTRNVFCNPCSEYVHLPYTSCNLGSINVSHLINEKGEFDWKKLESVTKEATLYLNGIIDLNNYPIEKIKKETLAVRPIGLGIMGLAHLFYQLCIQYDSKEAAELTEKICKYITLVSMRKSVDLAREHKKTYEYYDHNTFIDANKRFFTEAEFMDVNVKQLQEDIKKYGVYNSCFTSVAPTGTLSFLSDCSSGMEPVFGLVFTRKIEKDNKSYEKVYVVDPVFEKYATERHPDSKQQIYEYVSTHSGSCQGCSLLSDGEQKIFRVAGDLSPTWHLKILAAVANNISLSVSKSINVSAACTEKEIGEIYLKAHELGIIGVTVYREGSREGILVHSSDNDFVIKKNNAPKRPRDTKAELHLYTIGKHKYYTAVGFDKAGNPYEVFAGFNEGKKDDVLTEPMSGIIRKLSRGDYVFIDEKDGEKFVLTNGHSDETADALTRSISGGLRHGEELEYIVHQLEKSYGSMLSFSKVLARTLKKYIKDNIVVSGEECPECKGKLIRIEGCITCASLCGYSKCS
jgi:ribonucleoside-diphosphate reductase alpha chain